MKRRSFALLPLLASMAFAFTGCEPDPPAGENPSAPAAGGDDGSFKVFISNKSERTEMTVTEATTFGEVKAYALGTLNLAGQNFELRVAGKTPANTDTLADHGFKAPDQPMNMPVGNILVKIKD